MKQMSHLDDLLFSWDVDKYTRCNL